MTPVFEPTLEAARAAIAAVHPGDYARTRNHLQGAVTRLSPYVTHGFVTLPEVLAGVRERHRVPRDHKLVFELAWREYFAHVHEHDGEGIFESQHEGPLPEAAYARELPDDIRRGATGVPAIDRAVRELYATGWLHNHARMWLASYVVHLRKVHWRAGADWLYGHLLDGDLASNHLSWQWVAGTASRKPYLFNAENVARYAPAPWHSADTPLDTSYEALERLALSPRPVPVEGGPAVDEPPLLHRPPADAALSAGPLAPGVFPIDVHALRVAPEGRHPQPVLDAAFHARWPWSERRWRFVLARMAALGGPPCWCDGAPPPGHATPRLFDWPARRCGSFSKFWEQVGGA